jgi:tetratricopeptide (TPR) repeat protein
VHVLYREVLSRRQTPGLSCARHRQIGETIEALYGSDPREVAAELVEHFEAGLDWTRTVKYLRLAAETAQHRFAHREAETLLRRALELIERMPAAHRADAETDTLRRLASTYVASFDERCVDTYETMAARAARYNLTDLEIRALVDLSYCLSWFSAERALVALQRAMELSSQLEDPLLRAAERMNCLVGRVWVGGWNAQDAREAREALTIIRSVGDRHVLAPHLIGYAQIQWIFSEYRAARDCAVEGLAILMEYGGGNPYLSIPFQRGEIVLPRSLLFLGEWGRALAEIDTAITLADKNGDFLPAQMLQLNRAWIHLEARDFGGVLEICDRLTRARGNFASGYVLRLSLILGGAAQVGLGRYELALEKLSAARHGIDHQKILGDWYFRMPLDAALVDLWLAKGNHAAARRAAERLLSAALETEERTWQALAWDARARVAEVEGDGGRASQCIAQALALVESHELPLAAWRTHATAAQLAVAAGRDGGRHREASREVVSRLAASLGSRESLREIFLSAAGGP